MTQANLDFIMQVIQTLILLFVLAIWCVRR